MSVSTPIFTTPPDTWAAVWATEQARPAAQAIAAAESEILVLLIAAPSALAIARPAPDLDQRYSNEPDVGNSRLSLISESDHHHLTRCSPFPDAGVSPAQIGGVDRAKHFGERRPDLAVVDHLR
jgi:hypothetical protein